MSYSLVDVNTEIYEEDGYKEEIIELNGSSYLKRIINEIIDTNGNAVGEMTGYIINTENVCEDNYNSFIVMDDISQLLFDAHRLISKNMLRFNNKQKVLFLNRLSLFNYNGEIENEILDVLQDKYSNMIYSLGCTELNDKDFFEHQNEFYFKYWEKQLRNKGWLYNLECDFFYR